MVWCPVHNKYINGRKDKAKHSKDCDFIAMYMRKPMIANLPKYNNRENIRSDRSVN